VDEEDDLSNSGVSTVNSTKTKHHNEKSNYENKVLLEQLKILKIENSKLINELLESHKSLQSILKANDGGIEVLKSLLQKLTNFTCSFERSTSFGYFSDDQNRRSSLSIDTTSPSPDDNHEKSSAMITNNNSSSSCNNINSNNIKKLNIPPLFKNPQLKSPFRQCHDMKLMDWLLRNNFDEESRTLVANADFTYEDLIFIADKDDIRRIGLR
jgi:hypothetical protein